MRKLKAGRWMLALGAMLLTGLAADAFWFEPESLTVDRFDVQTPYWPQSTAPIRAVFLTDLHIDPLHMTPARVRKIVQQVNALHPDIVLLGGDYVGTDWLTVHRMRQLWARSKADTAREDDGFQALSRLSAPLGVYGVLGNHDCWWSCDEAARQLQKAGVHVLVNQSARVPRPGGDMWLAGLANLTTGHPDFAQALNGVPKGAAVITLIHEPDPFGDHPEAKLILAGHTHAGQVRFPWIGAPVRNSRYLEETAKGWLTRGDRILIVSRGLGESGVPVRFGAPPQIMVLNIHAGKAAAVSIIGRS
ncbi:metallophosphoesterase [Asticcacaulis sp. AC466]|uniref:metallophosphoesterase n=1 Tax=Asticcacaulis sp. AC466 TaxID=1282362 RepID=UPI001F2E5326|nr:metallophosphoesterase [Asticcacaulis sp. AC466]